MPTDVILPRSRRTTLDSSMRPSALPNLFSVEISYNHKVQIKSRSTNMQCAILCNLSFFFIVSGFDRVRTFVCVSSLKSTKSPGSQVSFSELVCDLRPSPPNFTAKFHYQQNTYTNNTFLVKPRLFFSLPRVLVLPLRLSAPLHWQNPSG